MPEISVIIPMFNAEKYIRQCLNSVLHQTFDDCEVIIVDDLSTDRSVEIVESMIDKFNGRLTLIKRDKNSGGAATPRNIALEIAKGNYIFFLDGDDVIIRDALKILIEPARNFDADVVHVEKYFVTAEDIINAKSKLRLETHQAAPFVDKPTVETNVIAERIKRFCRKNFLWWACSKLFRRNFLIENNVKFIPIASTEDMIFSFETVCLAKTYVRIPDTVYVYRQTQNSATRGELNVEQKLKRYVTILSEGTRELERFMNGLKFFVEHPNYRYAVLNFFVQSNVGWEAPLYLKAPAFKLDELLRENFSTEFADNPTLATQLFSLANLYRIKISQLQNRLATLQRKNTNGGAP